LLEGAFVTSSKKQNVMCKLFVKGLSNSDNLAIWPIFWVLGFDHRRHGEHGGGELKAEFRLQKTRGHKPESGTHASGRWLGSLPKAARRAT
jgi:hypothetical protein